MKKDSQELGTEFELITQQYFEWLFSELGFTVIKSKCQKSGPQYGFDVQMIIVFNYIRHRIFIECKNHKNDVAIGNIFKKAWDLEKNFKVSNKDLFIAINPRSNFKNEDDSEKSSPSLDAKFEFKYYALDTSNGVKDLFALNIEFYKQIYKEEPSVIPEKKLTLKKFADIIFSDKPFQKVFLDHTDKVNYLGNPTLNDIHIPRFVSEENRDTFFSILEVSSDLKEIAEQESKIILLGGAGSGKSTELAYFANSCWIDGEQTGPTPVLVSLKNFTENDTIEAYLPSKVDRLNHVIFMLDGIDEVANIDDFKSKLSSFIEKHERSGDSTIRRFILSCRTNIYDSIVNHIEGFKPFYILDIPYQQAIDYLRDTCGKIIDQLDFTRLINFTGNPYQLLILSRYISSNQRLPTSNSELWNEYISDRLKNDEIDKLEKTEFDEHTIREHCIRVSLVNELRQQNTISEEDLFILFKRDKTKMDQFLINPFIEKIVNQPMWYFDHRNIQEYFVATKISELDTDEIIKFITIPKTTDVHPTLFNSLTFLVDLLYNQSEKRDMVLEYIYQSYPESLFKSDSSRIDLKVRERIFQEYFRIKCIVKGLWLTTGLSSSLRDIAVFADCSNNFKYLFNIITHSSDHGPVILNRH